MSRPVDGLRAALSVLAGDPSTPFGEPGAGVEVLRRIDGPFSTVYRVRIDTPGAARHAYIKIMTLRDGSAEERARVDRMLAREFAATQRLHDALQQDHAIGALRPLALLPEHRTIVTEEVPGRPFSDLLLEGGPSTAALTAIAASVGRWIRVYQELDVAPAAPIELAERRRYLDDRLRLLAGRVLTPGECRAVLDRFDALSREIGVPAVKAVPIHADLTPANVIVDDSGRMTVLDFTMAKAGPALHDLTHFYFHLALMGDRHRRRQAALREAQAALLAGYAPTCSVHDPLFRLMLLQHAACHLAQLASRRVPIVDAVYRWFLRRRWRYCAGLVARSASRQVA